MGITSKTRGKVVGGVTESNDFVVVGSGDNRITFGSAAPTASTWKQGDVCFNTGATASATAGAGWICTTAGTPGTWKGFGTIAS